MTKHMLENLRIQSFMRIEDTDPCNFMYRENEIGIKLPVNSVKEAALCKRF